MSAFRDEMNRATDLIFERMGDPGTYTDPGFSASGIFILRKSVQIVGDLGEAIGRRDELSIRNKVVPIPLRNGVVAFDVESGLGSYQLKKKLSNDGYYQIWVVEEYNG